MSSANKTLPPARPEDRKKAEARLFRGIRWRLMAWNLLVLAAILAILGLGVFALVSQRLHAEGDLALRARTDVIRRGLVLLRAVQRDAPLRPILQRGLAAEGVFYLVVDRSGRVLLNPQDVELGALPDMAAVAVASRRPNDLRTVSLENGQVVRLYTVPLGEQYSGMYLQVGRSLAAERRAEQSLTLALLGGGLAGLGLAAVGGYFLAGRALVPIRQAFQQQQAFVADASHELRTPLTLIRANAEVLARCPEQTVGQNMDLVSDIVTETAHLSRLVGDLLTLARADAGQAVLSREPVALDSVVQDVGRRLAPLAEARRQTVEVLADRPCVVRGDAGRLQELVVILLDNAVKHGQVGGHIRVALVAMRGHAHLTVADDGPGIEPEHLPHLFERFYRVDRARPREPGGEVREGGAGAGLGLSIARWIVQAHGGRIQVTSTPGLGTTFTVTLPLAKA